MINNKPIDGLRGIAILSVLFYHLNISLFSGGYVGVDIFFVVSGYVIMLHIQRLMLTNNNYYLEYIERRVRRILPPFIVVILVVFTASTFILDSQSFENLALSQVFALNFISNIFFWKEAGYFNNSSQLKPLLHTWSLSVEVQLYLILPLIIIITKKNFKSKLINVIVVCIILSFLLSIIMTYYRPVASFFLVPTRIWEFLVGVFLSLTVIEKKISNKQADLIGYFGCVLILYSVFYYSNNTPFPGWRAILPVMGAAAIILACKKESVTLPKFLSFTPLVFVGLISYSLYLWHWPIIAFFNYLTFDSKNYLDIAIIAALCFLISTISWRYIELTFRHKLSLIINFKIIYLFYLFSIILILFLLGIFTYQNNGFPRRFIYANSIFSENVYEWAKKNISGEVFQETTNFTNPAILGLKSSKPSFIVWGDSHAVSVSAGIDSKAKEYGISGYLITKGSTVPFTGLEGKPFSGTGDWNLKVKQFILNNPDIKTVFLIAAWSNYTNGKSGDFVLTDKLQFNYTDRELILKEAFSDTVDWLNKSGRNIVYVTDVPILKYDPVRLVYLSKRFPNSKYYNELLTLISPLKKEYLDENKILNNHANFLGIKVINFENYFFTEGERSNYIFNNKLLYTDNNHISLDGACHVAPAFAEVFFALSHVRVH